MQTTAEESATSFREKDLEGHLHGEGSAAVVPQRVVVVSPDAGAPVAPSVGREARNVPDDPSLSADPVLKVGWETLGQRAR